MRQLLSFFLFEIQFFGCMHLLAFSFNCSIHTYILLSQLVKCLLIFQNEAQRVLSFSEDERESSFKDPIQEASTLVYTSL